MPKNTRVVLRAAVCGKESFLLVTGRNESEKRTCRQMAGDHDYAKLADFGVILTVVQP